MKQRILISSVLTIVLCFSLIVGSTFALFTAEDKFDITVTSGKVEIDATVGNLLLYSAKAEDGYVIEDLDNIDYSKYTSVFRGTGATTFKNGGTAEVVNGVVTITEMTPGDKVIIPVSVDKKDTNVAIQYRYKLVVVNNPASDDGEYITNALVVSVGNDNVVWTDGEYASTWTTWTAANSNDTIIDNTTISLELPVTAGNEYQGIEGVQFQVIVEAVQANGTN